MLHGESSEGVEFIRIIDSVGHVQSVAMSRIPGNSGGIPNTGLAVQPAIP